MQIRLIVPENRPGISAVVAYGPIIGRLCGGFTAIPATGGWTDATGTLIMEPVTIFDVFVADTDYPVIRLTRDLRGLASRVARDRQQECVYLSLNDYVEFIQP